MSDRSIYRYGLLEGKVVIVTGGGSGIGRRTAHDPFNGLLLAQKPKVLDEDD